MILPVALTIAGSDSCGGAGIQADIKAFAAMGVHGASAITAITAQNTVVVSDVVELSPAIIRAQIDRVVEDLAVAAVKTGMLASPEIIECVAAAIRDHALGNLVVDPVMVAKSGSRLLRDEAVETLKARLIPLALVITPNLPEAEVLLRRPILSMADRHRAARDLQALGCGAVILKGGHAASDAIDLVWDGRVMLELTGERLPTGNTHGGGCTFAAALAGGLARGMELAAAAAAAKHLIQRAIRDSLEIGAGAGPVNALGASAEALPAWAY